MSAIEPAGGREPRMPVSPQMALRVAIIGGVAMVMFGVIFFRLWYLQILSGEQYVQQANANRVRDLPIPAPRGEIIDRTGQTVVSSRVTNAVQIVPSALPPAGSARLALYAKLGRLLGMSPAHVQALVIRGRTQLPYAPITIKTDAGPGVLTVSESAPAASSPGCSRSRSRSATPRGGTWPPRCWATSATSPKPSSS